MDTPAVGHRSVVGVAGEYAVASELSRREWLATLTVTNSPGIDVLARHPQGQPLVALQVKSASPNRRAFQLEPKHEDPESDEWFVFVVTAKLLSRPSFHVVPATVVAALLYAIRTNAELIGKRVGAQRSFMTERVPGYLEAWYRSSMGRRRRQVALSVFKSAS